MPVASSATSASSLCPFNLPRETLLDTCVWGGIRAGLISAGHDIVWAGEWKEDPGDDEILARAYRDGRILITLDKDFGELAVVHGQPHAGIVRLVTWSSQQQAVICTLVLDRYGSELQAGAIVTAEPGRVRIPPPKIPRSEFISSTYLQKASPVGALGRTGGTAGRPALVLSQMRIMTR